MYCPHCDLQFSGSQGSGRCPYCGKLAQESPREERAAGETRPSRVPSGPAEMESDEAEATKTEAPSEWLPGLLVAGKYEVVSRVGAGGFGTVYKVRHIFRKKYYALKTPHAEFARDEVFLLRFEREIEAMERFVHPDAVMIRDSGLTEQGIPYYTMDFIEGESLKTVMRREGRLPVDRALRIIRRVLRVLAVAHTHQIIHRDIKPDNIMLTQVAGRETIKVLDFGVAKLLDLVGDSRSITHGMRVGTPKYMSPEQVAGESIDQRSDLFSVGVVFYEMLTGIHPFSQLKDPVRATAAILNVSPKPPREVCSDLPRTINDHVLWMLEKKPKRRPASAEALIEKLGALEEGVSRVEPVERLEVEVSPALPRGPAEPLVLRQETSMGERRSFFFFSAPLSFGRANDPTRGIRNDIIWRCLPCRSSHLDPENWARNLTISQRLGTMYPDGAALVIEPAPGAKYGIGIGGVRSFQPARIQVDRFHVSLGDRALELDGHRVLKGPEEPVADLSFLALSKPPGAGSHSAIGYSNPSCNIDHVRVQRASNWPLHEYFLVYRQVKLGSSVNDGMRLRLRGVEEAHAAVLLEGGEAFLMALDGRTVIRGAAIEGGSAPEGGRREIEVAPATLVPLRPGLEIVIGEAHLKVDAVSDLHFKSV